MERLAWVALGIYVCACSSAGESLFVSGSSGNGSQLSGGSGVSGSGGAGGATATNGSGSTGSGKTGATTGVTSGGMTTGGMTTGGMTTGGMTTGGTSGTTTGSSSTTGGGMDPCAPAPGDKDCQKCVKSHCCSQIKECLPDKNCSCMLGCYGKMANCQQICGGWGQQWGNLFTCSQTNCAIQCAFG